MAKGSFHEVSGQKDEVLSQNGSKSEAVSQAIIVPVLFAKQ